MSSLNENLKVSTSDWWSKKRLRFNLILLAAAALSFFCLLTILVFFSDQLPCLEITLFIVVGGAIAFTIGLCLANLFYFLGPLVERICAFQNPTKLRQALFVTGCIFSILLIFSPVIGNILLLVLSENNYATCV